MLYLSTLLAILGLLLAAESSVDEPGQRLVERRYRGLKFGKTNQDYVLFKPRMEPVEEAYSLCGWVKKILSGGSMYWFAYGTSSDANEIHTTANGYFYTLSTRVDVRSKVTEQLGTWRHVCLTWSLTTRAASMYYDGLLIGSVTTPSGKKLGLDGYIVLGNEFNSYGSNFNLPFGGELFKANLFDKELSAAEVKEMADGGLCSEVEEKYGRSRYLKWEDMLLEEKSGNVTEIDVGCTPELKQEDKEEASISEDCECEDGTTLSRWDLLRGDKFFNKTVTVELVEELKETWDILGDFEGATVTERFISHFKFFDEENTCK